MTRVPIINESPFDLPAYATPQSAGLDLRAHLAEPLELAPLEQQIVGTGLKIALPQGLEAQVRPRSGLAAKYGITVLNAPGTIDADYRGGDWSDFSESLQGSLHPSTWRKNCPIGDCDLFTSGLGIDSRIE